MKKYARIACMSIIVCTLQAMDQNPSAYNSDIGEMFLATPRPSEQRTTRGMIQSNDKEGDHIAIDIGDKEEDSVDLSTEGIVEFAKRNPVLSKNFTAQQLKEIAAFAREHTHDVHTKLLEHIVRVKTADQEVKTNDQQIDRRGNRPRRKKKNPAAERQKFQEAFVGAYKAQQEYQLKNSQTRQRRLAWSTGLGAIGTIAGAALTAWLSSDRC